MRSLYEDNRDSIMKMVVHIASANTHVVDADYHIVRIFELGDGSVVVLCISWTVKETGWVLGYAIS